jgi:hypothetical protein
MVHLKVFVRAAVFGLAAYAVVLGLVYVSKQAGLLDWIR